MKRRGLENPAYSGYNRIIRNGKGDGRMKVTYFGTTMLLFDDGKEQVLFDCHVTRPSIRTCLQGKLATDAAVAERVIREFGIDRLQGIFISHSHHDHVLDAPYFAVRCRADVYGSPSALNVARGGGVPEERLHSFADSMEYRLGEFHVSVLSSIHSTPHWYNNDLGLTIDAPLTQPARKSEFKEGGSFDFLVSHGGKNFLIRPSYNYLEGQLDNIRADVLFLGIAGLSKDTEARREKFFAETVDKVRPEVVVPVHWDHFFAPLYGDVKGMPSKFENTGRSMHLLAERCARSGVHCVVQLPLTSMAF